MDQSILVQYSEVMEEIKDLRERIRKLDRFLSDPPVVSDTVRGTRKDGPSVRSRLRGSLYRSTSGRKRSGNGTGRCWKRRRQSSWS